MAREITLDAVRQERAVLRADDVRFGWTVAEGSKPQHRWEVPPLTPGGHVVANLGWTADALTQLTPDEWSHVRDTLAALLDREPVRSSIDYSPERLLLGALFLELDSYIRSSLEVRSPVTDQKAPDDPAPLL